jgi:hypothetical protein
MMPQSAGDEDATLDLSDIDIQQARTIHEAMEQKLSPEEGQDLLSYFAFVSFFLITESIPFAVFFPFPFWGRKQR